MTNLQEMGKCFDAIQHNAELLQRQAGRRRHQIASDILKDLRNAKWYLSLFLQEVDKRCE